MRGPAANAGALQLRTDKHLVGVDSPAHAPAGPKRSNKTKMAADAQFLLNFSLPPRQNQMHNLPRRSRKAAGQGYGVWNKESALSSSAFTYRTDPDPCKPEFVNAQYRFVMKPSGDYTVHFADPDM